MKRRGMTLLEMLICGLLISCVVLGVAGLFAGCARAFRHSDNQEQAARMAEEAIEQARATPLAQLQLGQRTLPPQTLDKVDFQGVQEVLPEASTSPLLLKRVRVTVTWTYRSRRQQLVRESWLSALKN